MLSAACGGHSDDGAKPIDLRCGAPRDLEALPDPTPVYSQPSPAIDYFSPRAADLDGDGELELVTSGGSETPPLGELVALDGPSGEVLWRFEVNQQLYSSPVFLDVTGDGVKDVFAGGRNEA